MSSEKLHQKIDALVEKRDYKEALNTLKSEFKDQEEHFFVVLNLLGRYNQNQLDSIGGNKSIAVLSTELNHIGIGILRISRLIEEDTTNEDYPNKVATSGQQSDTTNDEMSEEDIRTYYIIAKARTQVSMVLIESYNNVEQRSIGELVKIIGMRRKYIASAVLELELLDLLHKKREQNLTRFMLNEKGVELLYSIIT